MSAAIVEGAELDHRDATVVVPSHVFVREFDGELVLLDLQGGDYFGLSELGLLLWHGLASGKTPREVAAEAVTRYEVDLATVTDDFARLTGELLSKGLLLPGTGSANATKEPAKEGK